MSSTRLALTRLLFDGTQAFSSDEKQDNIVNCFHFAMEKTNHFSLKNIFQKKFHELRNFYLYKNKNLVTFMKFYDYLTEK